MFGVSINVPHGPTLAFVRFPIFLQIAHRCVQPISNGRYVPEAYHEKHAWEVLGDKETAFGVQSKKRAVQERINVSVQTPHSSTVVERSLPLVPPVLQWLQSTCVWQHKRTPPVLEDALGAKVMSVPILAVLQNH